MTHSATMIHVPEHAGEHHEEESLPISAGLGFALLGLAIVAVLFVAGYAGYALTRPVPLFTY